MRHATHGSGSLMAVGAADRGPRAIEGAIIADVLDAWFEPAPSVVEAVSETLTLQCRLSPPA